MQFAEICKCTNRMPFAIFNQMNFYATVFPIMFCRFLLCFHRERSHLETGIGYCLLNMLETYKMEEPVERSKTNQNI